MPGPQSSDMRHMQSQWCQRSLWHQLALASCKFHSKIFFLMENYACIFQFPYFLLFLFFITILSYTLNLFITQLQTQQLMTSQIRSYIFNTNLYVCAHFVLKICGKKSASMTVLTRVNDDFLYTGLFLDHPVCM